VVATMILRMIGTPVFSDRTEFSVTTAVRITPVSILLAFSRITYELGISQHRSAELTLRTLPADQHMIEVEGVSRFLIQTP
jgi:hypothetical protein